MPISTYAELQDAVSVWLNSPEVDQSVPTLISLAEADMLRKVRHWRMEKRSTATLDTQYSAVPADFLEIIRMSITSGTTYELEMVSQAEMLDMRASTANGTGRPRYYAMTAGEIEVYPTPGGEYTLEMVYFARTAALSDSATSNWILTYYPDAYLYGTLLQAAPYLKDDERTIVWKGLYDQAIGGIMSDAQRAKFGGTGLRLKIRSY